MVKRILIISFVIFAVQYTAHSQPNQNKRLFETFITFKDSVADIGAKFIVQFTDEVILDNRINLSSLEDYKMDYRNGILRFSRDIFEAYNLDTNREYNLRIYYDAFPFNFADIYSNFETRTETDVTTGDTVIIATQRTGLFENIFEGTDLEKSGTLFRGFTIGSNRDLSVNSGFRLQLKGNLSDNIQITAALTDETTPIQPEGNTTKIQELDKVFIELKGNKLSSTLGDIELDFKGGDFFNFGRKIQGIKGVGDFGFADIMITGAVSRGKFASNSFNGTDGVQGPYRLTGADNEMNILVLSGTEKVYLDGILMNRGQNADYVIDYGIGEITFTNNRPITGYSRIVVDFEYTDRRYSRTLLGGNTNFKFLDNKLTLGINYVNEFDSKDNTIDFELSDSDREILSTAGNDRNKAVKSGVSYAGLDTNSGLGLGLYAKRDSMNGNAVLTFYQYAPGTDSSLYNVQFTFVGNGNGSYNKRSSLEYIFVGQSAGSYDTIVFIPIPTAYQIAGVNLSYVPFKDKSVSVDIQSAYSLFDANLFSESPVVKTDGFAFNGAVNFNQTDVSLFGVKFKSFKVELSNRVVNKAFNSLDRLNSVEFLRDYNVTDDTRKTENLMQGNILFNLNNFVNLNLNVSQLRRGVAFSSLRNIGELKISGDSIGLTNFIYKLEYINSVDDDNFINGKWIKNTGITSWKTKLGSEENNAELELSFGLNSERRENAITTGGIDSLQTGSFSFTELIPRVDVKNIFNFDFFAEFKVRNDDDVQYGSLFDLSNSYEQKYGLTFRGVRWLTLGTNISIRDRKYTDQRSLIGNTDNNTVLVKSQIRMNPFDDAIRTDIFYDVSSERTAKIERVFVKVPPGEGNYQYLGDIYGGGLNNENNFQLVNFGGDYVRLNIPTSELFPTIDLRTSVKINLKPHKFFDLSGDGFIENLFKNFSAESFFRIDEKSKDPLTDNIYFLQLGTFLNDSNTIQGAQYFQQDINFFENNSSYSLRLRYIQQKGFNQFASGNERLTSIQRSIRFRFGLMEGISLQMDIFNKTDNNAAPKNLLRNRAINSDGISFDFTYKPIPQIESGFLINFTRAQDKFPQTPTDADINYQTLRFIYSLFGSGRIRLEIERSEVSLNKDYFSIPYELTAGRVDGKSYYWRTVFDYNISRNLQASVIYDGRKEGTRKVIHEGRAQFTAFF